MQPHRFDFPVITNSDYTEELSFQVGDQYLDLNGHGFSAQLRASPHSDIVLASFETVSEPTAQGFFMVAPSQGALQVRFFWETIQTVFSLVYPSYLIGDAASIYYDLLTALPDGDQEVWLFGYFNIAKGITRG